MKRTEDKEIRLLHKRMVERVELAAVGSDRDNARRALYEFEKEFGEQIWPFDFISEDAASDSRTDQDDIEVLDR